MYPSRSCCIPLGVYSLSPASVASPRWVLELLCKETGSRGGWWYVHAKSVQSCWTLCEPTDCSLPGSSVYGILQARILDCITMFSPRQSFWPRNQTRVFPAWQADSLLSELQGRSLGNKKRLNFASVLKQYSPGIPWRLEGPDTSTKAKSKEQAPFKMIKRSVPCLAHSCLWRCCTYFLLPGLGFLLLYQMATAELWTPLFWWNSLLDS